MLVDNLFAQGTTFLKGRWSEQFGQTEILLARATDPEIAPHIDRLGLTPLFQLLARLHEVYGQRMGYTKVHLDGAESPLAKWHGALETYLAAVVFTHGRNAPLRQRLLEPYQTSAEAVRKARRRPAKQTEEPE